MLSVGDDDKAGFLAIEEFLDHHARRRIAEGLLAEHVVECGFGFGQRHRDDDTLAGSEAVGLDDDRRALLANVRQRRRQFGKHGVVGGRNVVTREEVLCERLAAFELRGLRRGGRSSAGPPKNRSTTPATSGTSGPTTVNRLSRASPARAALRYRSQPRGLVAQARLVGGAGIARRHDDLVDTRGLGRASRPGHVRGRRRR